MRIEAIGAFSVDFRVAPDADEKTGDPLDRLHAIEITVFGSKGPPDLIVFEGDAAWGLMETITKGFLVVTGGTEEFERERKKGDGSHG